MSFKLLKIGRARALTRRIGRCAEETQSVSKRRFGNAEPKRCASIRAALVAAAVCAAAVSSSLADTNITEHVMLTEDADWASLGTVNIAADAGIHLNGHNLTVSGFAGGGSIYSSSVLPGGYAVL